MKILLTSSQVLAVSEFCVDVAKGLMLAAILGQGIAGFDSIVTRVIGFAIVLIFSLVFLYMGVLLKKK